MFKRVFLLLPTCLGLKSSRSAPSAGDAQEEKDPDDDDDDDYDDDDDDDDDNCNYKDEKIVMINNDLVSI